MSANDMTILDFLQNDVNAESKDSRKYEELAKQADDRYPDRGYGGILLDIAKEERSHHKHLLAIIDDIKKHEEPTKNGGDMNGDIA